MPVVTRLLDMADVESFAEIAVVNGHRIAVRSFERIRLGLG